MSDEDLLGYLFDTLEAPDIERIERELEADELARARLEELRRVNRLLAEDDNIDPPMGLAANTLNLVQRQIVADDRAAVAVAGKEWGETGSKMRAVDFAVVASVLGLAAVLVLPAIATLRGDQARLACADNMRQLGVAISSYAHTENGHIPFIAPNGMLDNAGAFTVALKERELLGNVRHIICPGSNAGVAIVPSVDELRQAAASDPDRVKTLKRYMGGSYGYLMGFDQFGIYYGRSLADKTMPLVADRPPRGEEGISSPNSPNHGYSGQNILFADGSVRWLPSPIWRGENFFINNIGSVAAGLSPYDLVIGLSEAQPHPPSREQ